ncbi:hypothetical protein OG422_24210 [Streptomyces sp. NBC_01525]
MTAAVKKETPVNAELSALLTGLDRRPRCARGGGLSSSSGRT